MTPTPDTDQRPMRPVRSYVLREGRLTPGQRRALERLWPRYGVEPAGTLDLPALFGRRAPVWLEIGFGDGDALRRLAAGRPDVDFLGIEVHRPGVGRLLMGLEADGRTNVRVISTDAADVVRRHLPAASLERVLIFFPDPWPKKRHHKRRLIQPGFAGALARVLAPGGELHLATDWPDYAAQMRRVLDALGDLERIDGAGCRPRTRFEARGEDKGHAVHDLVYRRR